MIEYHISESGPAARPQTGQIVRMAQRRLGRSAYGSIRTLRCDYHEGVLTLRGRLPSFYLKQIAQTLVANVEGVDHVHNRIEVAYPHPVINSTE